MKKNQTPLNALKALSSKKRAMSHLNFFKTGSGDYAENDCFLGLSMPQIRELAKTYSNIEFNELKKLLYSKYHEARSLALVILVERFKKVSRSRGFNPVKRQEIYNFYLKHLECVDNWDLVDISAPYILGDYLLEESRDILYKLLKSKNLWFRRSAVMANWFFIRNGDLRDVFKMAQLTLCDKEDLIHKSMGWMLREAAKKDFKKAKKFLDQHSNEMPRTMLRYAIEKFPEKERKEYLKRS